VTQLVVLKIGSGSFAQGFPVTLQIGAENERATIETLGILPPAPDLIPAYEAWQRIYSQIDWRGRPIGLPKPADDQPKATVATCQAAANQFLQQFNTWLQSESLRQIREKWLEKLQPADTVRIIIQANDFYLQKLPWHLWDLVERYPKAEVAISAPAYEQSRRSPKPTARIRILAILGNSEGIDIQADRKLLEQLPNAEVKFLIEPRRSDLTESLWQKPWDIFFFAGHSATQAGGAKGVMAINPQETLTLEELKYALRNAVAQGLKLAIFNSCDGLGLAREFADMQIPQLVVMREPVPDRIAQSFLQFFLAAFAQNKPLYLAVREARERLQGLEDEFPCATWLPIIFQNPAVDRPPTWLELLGKSEKRPLFRSLSLPQRGLSLLIGLGAAIGTLGIRHAGWLQSVELGLYDHMLQLRPQEPPDGRLLVIEVTEEDVKRQTLRGGSLSDQSLSQLLTKLEPVKPRAIGVDVYRDFAVEKKWPNLAKQLQNDRLIAVCRVLDPIHKVAEVTPPPEVLPEQLGFSNFVLDGDQVVRRHLLSMQPPANAKCTTDLAFSSALALRYLADDNIPVEATSDQQWKVGNVILAPLQSHQGGYQGVDAWGSQILLNYRNYRSPAAIADRVTLSEALSPNWNPKIAKDRIVIIGTTAESFKDFSLTPYYSSIGNRLSIPGVMLQAQMVSQLLSAVLDQRPLLRTWPAVGEWGWIVLWAIGGTLLGWLSRPWLVGVAGLGAIVVLYVLGAGGLIMSAVWIPVVPGMLALVVASIAVHGGLPKLLSLMSRTA
jgi:CHASE2 domain-containing sensor protein